MHDVFDFYFSSFWVIVVECTVLSLSRTFKISESRTFRISVTLSLIKTVPKTRLDLIFGLKWLVIWGSDCGDLLWDFWYKKWNIFGWKFVIWHWHLGWNLPISAIVYQYWNSLKFTNVFFIDLLKFVCFTSKHWLSILGDLVHLNTTNNMFLCAF